MRSGGAAHQNNRAPQSINFLLEPWAGQALRANEIEIDAEIEENSLRRFQQFPSAILMASHKRKALL